jgi:CelD/BcsL family acetyltransferase involved in cellulose biosynthesis
LSIRESIRSGMKVYDLLRGAETYKRHLGGQPVTLYRCTIELR